MTGELESVKVELHCLKEPDYTMTLMSSYRTLEKVDEDKVRIYNHERTTVGKNQIF